MPLTKTNIPSDLVIMKKGFICLLLMLGLPSCKVEDKLVTFPGDHGTHYKFIREWWYVNFILKTEDGKPLTGMVSYFDNGFRVNTLCSPTENTFKHYFLKGDLSCSDMDLKLRWKDKAGGTEDWFYREKKGFVTVINNPNLSLRLQLTPVRDVFLIGGRGYVPYTYGDSYYYSYTRLKVDGEINQDGVKKKITGIGSYDHQWGNFSLKHTWNWFSLRLNNGSDIIFWEAFAPSGQVQTRYLSIYTDKDSIINDREYNLEGTRIWQSPQSRVKFTLDWHLKSSKEGIDLKIKPDMDEQEIYEPNLKTFWEGSIKCKGSMNGREVEGEGFAELVPNLNLIKPKGEEKN
jgi:predicted secreted hydrolase